MYSYFPMMLTVPEIAVILQISVTSDYFIQIQCFNSNIHSVHTVLVGAVYFTIFYLQVCMSLRIQFYIAIIETFC